MIRTRFAPSPTGYLHIGGVRTALFNYLYARNQGGLYFLRIEDTDLERSRPEYEDDILSALKWLGLEWDGEILHQSRRLDRYREVAADLVGRGAAFEETVDGKKAIRFKMPKTKVRFPDTIRGDVEFDATLFDDLVIMKSDGYPTYHFACVVDDHDMEITHVIRGEDHLSNTPRQILIFQALGWQLPHYAHLPLILGADGTPLSKRHGSVSLRNYQLDGYLPPALLNYLALLGWESGGQQEFFRLPELVKKFSLKRITKSGARFDRQKLDWVNSQHIKTLGKDDYLRITTQFLKKESEAFSPVAWEKLVLLYQTRISTLKDLPVQASYCFGDIAPYDTVAMTAFMKITALADHLTAWTIKAEGLPDFDNVADIEKITREIAGERAIEARDLIHPLRFALTGKTASPGLFELMSVLGKQTCLKRVQRFIDKNKG